MSATPPGPQPPNDPVRDVPRRAAASPWLPWDHFDEVLLWLVVALVTTIIGHSAIRAYRVHKGRE